jgi:exopolyphosphatase/guanosine-5'-triphosphate,3'-diphosphate pyrophosphatase
MVKKNPNVAVIDIGSNTIKSLVAARGPGGNIVTVHTRALDARISTGIAQTRPRLTDEDMQRGLTAIRQLLAEIASFVPRRTALVATSAVRDAANGGEFRDRIRIATGYELRILTGEEEAHLIGRGLTADPALADLQDFYVFDLGGGSLECLTFCTRRRQQAVSLPLGCVRLTERCVNDPQAPFRDECRSRITEICREVLAKSGFRFSLPTEAGAVFTGGTATTARAIFAERLGRPIAETSPLLTVAALRALLDDIAIMPLEARKKVLGLPAARADVFPTALATVLAVAVHSRLSAFRHSFNNLRWGLATELLD